MIFDNVLLVVNQFTKDENLNFVPVPLLTDPPNDGVVNVPALVIVISLVTT